MNLPFADAAKPMDIDTSTAFARAVVNEGLRQMADRIETKNRIELDERKKDDQNRIMITSALASTEQIREISVRIETHQQAVIQALIENQRKLGELSRQRDQMLAEAYVLDDGRCVFKSEDGQRVFDEHGLELSGEHVDPDIIPDSNPTWETFKENGHDLKAVREKREDLFEYQQKLDDAEARIAKGGLTEADIDELGALLDNDAPAAIRAQLDADKSAELATDAPTDLSNTYATLDDLEVDGPMPG